MTDPLDMNATTRTAAATEARSRYADSSSARAAALAAQQEALAAFAIDPGRAHLNDAGIAAREQQITRDAAASYAKTIAAAEYARTRAIRQLGAARADAEAKREAAIDYQRAASMRIDLENELADGGSNFFTGGETIRQKLEAAADAAVDAGDVTALKALMQVAPAALRAAGDRSNLIADRWDQVLEGDGRHALDDIALLKEDGAQLRNEALGTETLLNGVRRTDPTFGPSTGLDDDGQPTPIGAALGIEGKAQHVPVEEPVAGFF